MGSQNVREDWATFTFTSTFHWPDQTAQCPDGLCVPSSGSVCTWPRLAWLRVTGLSSMTLLGLVCCSALDGPGCKESACSERHPGSIPGFGKTIWVREQLATPLLLPGEFQGQRNLTGYSPMGSHRVRQDWATNTHALHHIALKHLIFYTRDALQSWKLLLYLIMIIIL